MRAPELRLNSKPEPSLEEWEALLLILLGFGLGSLLLALLYNSIRHRVFGDVDSLDQAFDAGGKVSTSLTAVTVAVQLLWPADLLQSATVTAKYGISGGFWYSISVIIIIQLFPLLSLQFKTRAPGAKTFLQLIKARFGPRTHQLYCVYALLTNAVVTAVLVVAGAALYRAVVKDISAEMVVILLATLFGSYSFVGGLGSTFYVSYFNAVITLCVLSYFVAKIFYMPDAELPFGNFSEIHEKVSKLVGPEDNEDRSYLTFWSGGSMMWAAQGVVVCLAVVFCDQASWQSKIAAKPMQGVLGFFFASLIWFAIPSTIGTSAGLAYLAYSGGTTPDNITTATTSNNISSVLSLLNASVTGDGNLALSAEDIDSGLVTPLIADLALGKYGGVVLLTMFTMLMMSTGSGEVMAVSSIIVYDIYQTYIRPFRRNEKKGHCLLCGRPELGEATDTTFIDAADAYCYCPSVVKCSDCARDREMIANEKFQMETVTYHAYSCPHHGHYRTYQDSLVRLKSWVLLWVAIGIVPLGLLVLSSGINLNWIFLNGAIVIVQAFPGIALSIVWVKATSQGLVAGSLAGLVCGLAANLTRAASLEGGLGNFLTNTADNTAVLAGSGTSFIVSLLVTVVVSLATHNIRTPADAEREWQKLRDVDNPLRPWQQVIREDGLTSLRGRRPTYQELDKHYRLAKITTYVGSVVMVIVFLVIIPGFMASLHTMTSSELQSWLMSLHLWCFVTSAIVVILTPVEEVWSILATLRQKMARKKEGDENGNLSKGEICISEQKARLISEKIGQSPQQAHLDKTNGEGYNMDQKKAAQIGGNTDDQARGCLIKES